MGGAAGITEPGPVTAPAVVPRHAGEREWAAYLCRIAAGSSKALAELYDDTSKLVYSAALRILGDPANAEEVTLDVYTQIWRTAATFDAARGSALSWMLAITRSRAIDLRRQTASRSGEERLSDHPMPAGAVQPSLALGLTPRLSAALESLSSEQREAIEMIYFAGLNHGELAGRLGVPLGTAKARLRRGMLKLREALGERNGDPDAAP